MTRYANAAELEAVREAAGHARLSETGRLNLERILRRRDLLAEEAFDLRCALNRVHGAAEGLRDTLQRLLPPDQEELEVR